METVSWILLLINVVLIIIILYKFSNNSGGDEEDEKGSEIEITYLDGKKEKITNVENYDLEEYNDYFSIYLKGEDPIYIKDSVIRKIHVK